MSSSILGFLIVLLVGEMSFGKKLTGKPIMPVPRDGANCLFISQGVPNTEVM